MLCMYLNSTKNLIWIVLIKRIILDKERIIDLCLGSMVYLISSIEIM